MTSVGERRARFRALHAADRLFVLPNPWDAGSARLLAACGFEALATTSAGAAAYGSLVESARRLLADGTSPPASALVSRETLRSAFPGDGEGRG